MKFNKKVVEGAFVGAFTLAMVINANTSLAAAANPIKYSISAGVVETISSYATQDEDTEKEAQSAPTAQKAKPAKPENTSVLQETETKPADKTTEKESKEPIQTSKKIAVAKKENTKKVAVAEKKPQKKVKKKKSKWSNRLMPKVEEYLNIRAQANEEAEIVGKLYKGAAAEIIETKDGWTKITSGNVEGYVKNDFCAFDNEAEKMAKAEGTVVATAKTGGLRVRAKASDSEDTPIVELMPEEGKIEVDQDANAPQGWVPVIYEEETAYVSKEYVEVELELGKAISIEEEQAAAREEAANSAEAASQNTATAASSDEVTLLGALIQCEAGGESYEGQLAVGAVVMNRLRQGYAGSISGVIYQSGQFTPAASGALASALSSGVRSSCIQAAQQALSGVDNVNGATNFQRAGSGASGYVIGNHVFF